MATGADCSAGGARAGVSLPGVLSTRVFVLFRLTGRSGESGTRSTSFSGVAALVLPLLTILSASTRSLSLL
jgi:hypothetical protein